MSKTEKRLSASRIKVLKSCSWQYWCKYVLNLPDKTNDGASRGSICHLIFDVLGKPRHRNHFTQIIRKQDAFASEPIKRLILKHARILGVDDTENIESIKAMILTGLSYDFFGLNIGKPTESISEHSFLISKDEADKRYNVVGFIDKLYLYKKKKKAIIRDFKSSKSMFKGGEIDDNLQDWIYSLAVKEEFPEYSDRTSEFLFLKFMEEAKDGTNKGVLSMDNIDDHALEAFEYELTYYQQLIEDFDIDKAMSNYAADQGFPTDGTFSCKLCCGFATYKGQIKKDGTPMWHCPFKFDFDYYSVINSDGEVVKNFSLEEFDETKVNDEHMFVKMTYDGCPKFKS